jgi:hypothetical protein
MPGSKVTSMERETGTADIALVAPVLVKHLAHTFGWQSEWASLESIGAVEPGVLTPSGR